MADEAIASVLAGIRSQPYRGRSDLYRWLRANHRRLSRRLAEDQASWRVLAEEIGAAGIKNTKGHAPSRDSVRKAWATVCRDVAKAEALKRQNRPIGGKFPSRMSPNWRPQEVQLPGPPRTAVVASGALLPASASAPDTGPPDFPTVDPSGAPLAEGHVFYRGRSMPRSAAENLVDIDRQSIEMDRFK